jgi:hypothetical protein
MGIAYSIDPDGDGIVVVWDGEVSDDEHVEHILRLAEDRRWPPTRFHLTDFTSVTATTQPNWHVIDALVDGTQMRDGVEQVVVIGVGDNAEELAQSARDLALRPKVFTDLDDACKHLGIDAAQARATVTQLRNDLATDL